MKWLGYLRFNWRTHLAAIALACLIWVTASYGVKQTELFDSLSTLRAELPENVGERFEVINVRVPDTRTNQPTLEVTGPPQRITAFRERLEKRQRGLVWSLNLEKSDLRGSSDWQDHRGIVRLPLSRFKLEPLSLPLEVSVTFANPDKLIEVVIEERVDIPVTFFARDIKAPEGLSAQVNVATEATARGRYSRILDVSKGGPTARIELGGIDLRKELETPEQIAKALVEPISRELGFRGAEGIDILSNGKPLDVVKVQVIVRRLSQLVPTRVDAQIVVRVPRWLQKHDHHVNLENTQSDTYPVTLRVSEAQVSQVNDENVSVIIDISHYSEEDLLGKGAEAVEGAARRRRVYLREEMSRLEIGRQIRQYELERNVDESQFIPFDVAISWQLVEESGE